MLDDGELDSEEKLICEISRRLDKSSEEIVQSLLTRETLENHHDDICMISVQVLGDDG